MDDHAAKVRMQATKAEKLKLSAMKQLESLAGTLAAVSDKADSDQLKTQVLRWDAVVYASTSTHGPVCVHVVIVHGCSINIFERNLGS